MIRKEIKTKNSSSIINYDPERAVINVKKEVRLTKSEASFLEKLMEKDGELLHYEEITNSERNSLTTLSNKLWDIDHISIGNISKKGYYIQYSGSDLAPAFTNQYFSTPNEKITEST